MDGSKKHNRKPGNQETADSTGWIFQRNITGNQETCDRLDSGGQFRET